MSALDTTATTPNTLAWAAVARFAAVALFFDSLAPLFPQMAAQFDLPGNAFQLVLGISYSAFAACQLLAAHIIRKIGLYRTIAWSSMYLGAAVAAVCLAHSTAIFVAALLSMFIGNSFGSNATRLALREATTDTGFKRMFAWASGTVQIKQIAMPCVAVAISAAFDWRVAMFLLVIPVVMAGAWIALAPKPLDRLIADATSPRNGQPIGWLAVLRCRAFLIPTLIAAIFQIAFSPLSARLPFLLAHEAGWSPASIGLGLSGASAAIAAGFFLSGHLISRWTSRRILLLGWTLMCVALLCMLLQRIFGVAGIVAGTFIVQAALGLITVPCSGDALSAFSAADRIRASSLFGLIQPAVSGLSVAMVGALDVPNVQAAIVLTAVSATLIAAVAR